jgi:hypothetical protein
MRMVKSTDSARVIDIGWRTKTLAEELNLFPVNCPEYERPVALPCLQTKAGTREVPHLPVDDGTLVEERDEASWGWQQVRSQLWASADFP